MSVPAPRKLIGGLTALRDVNLSWSPPASWVAVGPKQILVSNDGMTWDAANNNPFADEFAYGVAWNGGYWLAVGFSGSDTCIAKSLDGLTWSPSSNNPFSGGRGYGVAWNGSYWVALGFNTDDTISIAKSSDGMTWTPSTNSPFSGAVGSAGLAAAWNGSYWVAVGNNGDYTVSIAKSSDGMSWTDASNNLFSGVGGTARGVAWNGSYWIAVGGNDIHTVSIAKSSDGITWTESTNNPFEGFYGFGVAWNGSYWIAVGTNTGNTVSIAKSTNGMDWTPSTNNPFAGANGNGISWNGSYWIAVGTNTDYTVSIAKSTDGMTWTPSTNNLFIAEGNAVAAGGPVITGYRLSSGGTNYDLTETSKQLTDLTVGTTYNFTVKTDISGEYSVIQSFPPITPIDTVPPPVNLFGFPGVRTANLEWNLAYPYLNVTGYRLHNGGTTYTLGPNKKTTITGLDVSASYSFTIETDISGVLSSTANFGPLTTFTPPKPVGLASAPGGFTSVSISWVPPAAWVAAAAGRMLVSADGANWISVANGLSAGSAGKAVAWNGSYWLGVCADSGFLYTVVKSLNGNTWAPSLNNPFATQGVGYQSGNGIAWNGSYWVMVGNGQYTSVCIATSTDGNAWTNSTDNPFDGGLGNGIAWNGSYWIAVGYNAGATVCIAKSSNGMTWTDISSNPFSGGIGQGIAWNGSYWVAVGSNTDNTVSIAKSLDSITWTASTNNPFSGNYGAGIAYGGGLWVAVGTNGNAAVCIASSIDGMNWTPSNNNPFAGDTAIGIAWNGSYWVATGNNGADTVSIATSTDGMNWIPNSYWNGPINSVAAGKSVTITGYRLHSDSPSLTYNIAPASSRLITGLQGTYTFTIETDVSGDYSVTSTFPVVSTIPVPVPKVFVRPRVAATEIQYYWNALAMYLAGGEGDNRLAYTFDGINWTASTSGNSVFTDTCFSVVYGNGKWVAAGSGTNQLAYSGDGINWTGSESGNSVITVACRAVAYANGKWVAGGEGENTLAYSTDGISWTASTSGNSVFTNQCYAVAYANGKWVAGGEGINQLAYSTDGETWTASTSGNSVFTNQCYAVAYGNNKWVAGGTGINTLAYSTDGINWTASTNGNSVFTIVCRALAYANNLWVAGGSGNATMAYSTDGINWTISTSGSEVFVDACNEVTYASGIWVAGGGYGTNQLAYSTDGINWTASESGNSLFLSEVYVVAAAALPATYLINSVNPALNYTVAGTNIEVTGLTPLTDYSFTITTDLSGISSVAAPFRTVRTSTRPLPVATLTSSQSIVAGELNLTFNWTDPEDYAWFYTYSLRAATGTRDTIYEGTSNYGITLSHTFTGLDPGRSYTFNIRRGNDAGYSTPVSATSTAVFFDPRSITGLRFWVDATDTTGSGTSVADGTTVTTWYDKSGTANNGTGSGTLRTDARGRYMDMSGNSYALTTSSWIYNQYFNIFVVDTSGNGSILEATAASTDAIRIAYDASGIILSTYADHSALGDAYETVAAPVNIWCFSNYGGKTAYWNKLVSGKDYSHAASFVVDSLLKLGTYSGKMREVLIYTGVMAEDNRAAVQNYLYTKWFTQPNLIPLVPVDNGCVMWLDATDATTIFQDANGTVPVTGDSQVVLRWNDKSGYDNHMDTSGVSPTYNISTFDGLPGIHTTGDVSGSIQTAPFLQSGDASLFIIAYTLVDNMSFGYFKHDISGNFGLIGNPNISWRAGPSPNNNIFVNVPNNVPFIFYGTMKKDQLMEGTFVNSTGMQKSYSVEGINVAVAAAPIQLNGVNDIVYGEVIYYNRALTAAEVQQNATYLSNKWKIPIPATTTFSPPAAPGLQLWLDSADPYTVFEDASGLLIWKDRSGLGNNAMPHGSLPVSDGIVFNGSQYLSLPDRALPQGAYSYYAVAKFSGDSQIIHGGSKDISGQIYVAVTSDGEIAYSYDLLTWNMGNSPFEGVLVNGIAWNGSYWIAVGQENNSDCIAKSTDGIIWTAATDNPFSGDQGRGIGWNGTYWVAVGFNDSNSVCIAKSVDGMTWTNSTENPFDGGLGCGIAWNGTYWIAVGKNTGGTVCIAKSTDGMEWIIANDNPFSGDGAGYGVAWNGTYWVAVGQNSNGSVCIAKSTNGLDWTNSTNNPFTGGAGYGVAWNGSYWIAVGTNTNYTVGVIKSTDGMTWTPSTNNPFGGEGHAIIWNGAYWVAGGSGASPISTSTDGLTWTINNVLTGALVLGIAAGPAPLHNSLMDIKTVTTAALYVAGGSGDNKLIYSSDGITWNALTSGNSVITDLCLALVYANGIWVAGGEGTNQIAYSTDGITWSASESGNSVLTDQCSAVAYGNGIWVAGGFGTNVLAYSSNGIDWTGSSNQLFTDTSYAVGYGNGVWVAGGEGTNQIGYSGDGISWTASGTGNSLFTDGCYAVAYGNGLWVAGGGGTTTLIYSTDGETWTASTSGSSIFTAGVYSLKYANGLWVAGGQGTNQLAYSIDGITWTASESGNLILDTLCLAVGYTNGLWLAGGQGTNRLAYSTDGINWTASTSVSALITNSVNTVAGSEAGMYAATTFDMGRFDLSGSGFIPNLSTLTDTNVIPPTQTVIIESIYSGTGKSLFLNGLVGSTDTSTHTQDASNNFIGWDMSGNYMNGTIKEIIVYGAAHTATERKQVEAYLKAKWYPQTYAPSATALWLDSTSLTPGRLQTWPDRSGHGDLSQNAIWAQPLCSTDAVTGRQGVQFAADGIANGFSAQPFGTTDSWSVFSVQRYDYSSNQPAELENNVCTAYETVAQPVQVFMALGSDISGAVCIITSTDGVTWTPSTNNPFDGTYAITAAWNGSYWLAGGAGQPPSSIAKSTDGMTWTLSTDSPFQYGYGLAWNGTYWLGVGRMGDNSICIAKSTDGMTWIDSSGAGGNNPFTGGEGLGIAWNGLYWLAVGYNTANTVCIAKSTNGINWSNSTNNPFSSGAGRGIAWNGSYWVAVGSGLTVCIAKSTNGMDWTDASNNPFDGGFGSGIAWNGFYWIAVGANTDNTVCIAKSTNGIDWTDASNNPFDGGFGSGIAWNGTYWVAVGRNDDVTVTIAKSLDGMTWSNLTNPFDGAQIHGITTGYITFGSTTSVGTDTTSTPSVNEIKFYTGDTATAEIHKAPVLVEEIVNVSILSEVVNGTLLNRYTAGSLTNNLLRIGFTGSLTPSLRGAMRGYIYELIAYNRIVAKDEQQAVEGYLSWKWGIPLPTTHPYYILPPTPQTPFTPIQIAGCQLWLDGADATTIDLSGTTVIAWADKSGLGNNTTGFVGMPTYGDGVVFDGESGFSLPDGTIPFGDSSYSIYAIFNIATADDGNVIILAGEGVVPNSYLLIFGNSSQSLATSWGGNGVVSSNAYSPGVTTLFDTFYVSGGDLNQFVNGSNRDESTPQTPRDQANTNNSLGFAEVFEYYMTGTIKEILVYNTAHSTAERQRVEGYLATKWGLQSSLPVSHPYYLPPPISANLPIPLQITGCQLWLDSADASTIIVDGGIVTQWNDKSDLSNNAIGFGNLTDSSGIVFDGVDSYFTLPLGALPYNNTSYTYFIVLNPTTIDITNGVDIVIINGGAFVGETPTNTTLFINQYDDHKCRQDWNYNLVESANTLNVGQQNLVIMQYTSGGLRRFFMNSAETSDTPGVTRIQDNTNNIIGNYDGSSYYSGSISEIIVYDVALSDSQRNSVKNYLTAKWNL